MSVATWIETALGRAGVDYKISGHELTIDCPECDDTRKHLYINPRKKVWICFKCNERGRMFALFRKLGVIGAPEVSLRRAPPKPVPQLPHWPPNAMLEPGDRASKYLRKRGMTDEDLKLWRVRKGQDKYAEYVLWPVMDDNEMLLGVHCRRFALTGSRGLMYPVGVARYLLGVHLTRKALWRMIVLVEGPYDAVHVTRELLGDNVLALALMGHTITPAQCVQLHTLGLPVRVLLDADAARSAVTLAQQVRRWVLEARPVFLPKGDPDEFQAPALRKVLGL